DGRAARSGGPAVGGAGGDVDDRRVAGREVRSLPAAADLARRQRGAAAVSGNAGTSLGRDDQPRSRGRCTMNSRTKILLGVVGGGCLLVGLLLGRGRSSGQVNAAMMPTPEAPATPGPRPLELAAQSREKNPVKVASAELARIAGDIQVVGTVAFHEDHYALVGPLVSGRISRLAAGVGDQIHRGQILAEVESAEVGQARADLVAAKARYSAADANLHRETELADKRISSERERELAHAQWV